MDQNQKSTVAVVRCTGYEPDILFPAISSGLELLGGARRFAAPGEQILLKPNLLNYDPPEKAVDTHPAVTEAVARCFMDTGCTLSMGDSPGGVGRTAELAARAGGLLGISARLGISVADFAHSESVPYPDGKYCRSFDLCLGAKDADGIINICKMKTHALERVTGAVKNLFGCVHGAAKAAAHARWRDADSFAGMLCDLSLMLRPRLHIMDGVLAMEGNGPASGDPVRMNVLLFSEDPVALDSVFCHIIGLDPGLVPTCVLGQRMGLGRMDDDVITLLTPDGSITMEELARDFGKPDFKVERPARRSGGASWVGPLARMIGFGAAGDTSLMSRLKGPGPQIDQQKCICCDYCVKCCPLDPPAVRPSGAGRPPRFSYRRCVRCYCCQESCPKGAINVRPGR